MYKKKNEVKELLDKIQRENIASARISVTTEKSLGVCGAMYIRIP